MWTKLIFSFTIVQRKKVSSCLILHLNLKIEYWILYLFYLNIGCLECCSHVRAEVHWLKCSWSNKWKAKLYLSLFYPICDSKNIKWCKFWVLWSVAPLPNIAESTETNIEKPQHYDHSKIRQMLIISTELVNFWDIRDVKQFILVGRRHFGWLLQEESVTASYLIPHCCRLFKSLWIKTSSKYLIFNFTFTLRNVKSDEMLKSIWSVRDRCVG